MAPLIQQVFTYRLNIGVPEVVRYVPKTGPVLRVRTGASVCALSSH